MAELVMNVKSAIAGFMRSDITLSALLPGGVYDGREISLTMGDPNPFDAVKRVRPCALVRHEVSAATGPRRRFSRQFVAIFFYDYAGYDAINEAMARTRQILHERRIGNGAYTIEHVDTVDDQYDDAILAYMHRARYEVAVKG